MATTITRFEASQSRYVAGETALITAVFSGGPVSVGLSSGSLPILVLSNGSLATYDASRSDLSNGRMVFAYTVGARDRSTGDLNVIAFAENDNRITATTAGVSEAVDTTVVPSGNGTLVHSASNDTTVEVVVASTQTGDLVAPKIASMAAASGTYYKGQTVDVSVTFNEVVLVNANGACRPSRSEMVRRC